MLALWSPISKVCCMDADVSVVTHANYHLEQKQKHKGLLGYLWAFALYPLTPSDL